MSHSDESFTDESFLSFWRFESEQLSHRVEIFPKVICEYEELLLLQQLLLLLTYLYKWLMSHTTDES